MPTVTENVDLPAGVESTNLIADMQLVGDKGAPLREAYDPTAGKTIAGYHSVRLDTAGAWSLVLPSNEVLLPAGTAWRRLLHGPQIDVSPAHVAVPKIVAASAASRTSNVVTATVPLGHGLTINRTVTVSFADTSYNGTFVIASTPTSTTVTWAQVASDDVAAGAGTLSGHYRVDEILADPPGSVVSSALSAHAADTGLHKGGQELAIAQLTVDTSTTGTTSIDVVGGTITFIAPPGPFVVEVLVPVRCSVIGVIANLRILVGALTLSDEDYLSAGTNDRINVRLAARIPTPVGSHAPAAGTEVTYKLQISRSPNGAAGTVETFATGFGIPIREAHIRAYTLGKGA